MIGAGASVELGIPAMGGFGELIDEAIRYDAECRSQHGTDIYFEIKGQLVTYYQSTAEANYERVYHVLHELHELRSKPGAVPRFRPVMYPFIRFEKPFSEPALRAASSAMLKVIYETTSRACDSPERPLQPLQAFLSTLRRNFLPRIYTTNYDDFFEQAGADDYFNGFTKAKAECKLFDPSAYWSKWHQPGCFHMHGSVHMGFPRSASTELEIGEIGWFASREEARAYAGFNGSGLDQMDGTELERSPIITGLNKLGRLQQSPFASYYAGFSREAMEADVIFVLGSGLADLHMNTWLRTARHRKQSLPLVYVGYWRGGADDLCAQFRFESGNLETALFHDLNIDLMPLSESQYGSVDGWTVDARGSAAVWSAGFQSFLNHPDALEAVLRRLGVN